MGVKGRGRGAPQARSGAALGADFETAVFDGRCMGVGHMRIFFTRALPAVVWGVVGLWYFVDRNQNVPVFHWDVGTDQTSTGKKCQLLSMLAYRGKLLPSPKGLNATCVFCFVYKAPIDTKIISL